MNKQSGVSFLFAIAKEIKISYECPIILLTQKDYADNIYNTLVSMRRAILERAPINTILEIVNTFHFEWLQAVQDVENLQKRAKDTPRESVLKSLDYTMDCINNRHKYFQQYIDFVNKSLSQTEKAFLQEDLKIIKDMREIDGCALLEKQTYLTNSADKAEFTVIVLDEIKELFNWLDRLYDCLSEELCKLFELYDLPPKLSKTLQDVIDNMVCFISPEGNVITALHKDKSQSSLSLKIGMFKDNDINTIVEKIKKLEDRISYLKKEKSSACVLALQHKAIFFEDRLESLANLKLSLSYLKKKKCLSHKDKKCTNEEDEVHIFNHLLPHQVRCHLVEKLVRLWETAIGNPNNKSTVSIIRTTDEKDVFRDDLGRFTVDKYGRKLYTKKDDHLIYQLDDMNTLIPINDDEHHVYFYDECGRYYLTDNRVRVYKAHQSASEYMLQRTGILLKMSETVDGVKYQYDILGRYAYEDGVKIYCNQGSTDKYRPDGLGNLEKIRDEEQYNLGACPVDPIATDESLYLKKAVGEALKKCVAEVVMTLPLDPIQYLADRLEKYHFDMDANKNRRLERQELMAERELLKPLESVSSKFIRSQFVEPEECFDYKSGIDYNFINYQNSSE